MAKKEEKTNVMRLLTAAKIPFTPHYYDHSDGQIDGNAIARKLSQPPEQVFKTLVTRGTGKSAKNYYVFVIPVEGELDLKAAAKAAGEKAIEMIRSEGIEKTHIFCYQNNETGQKFWSDFGFVKRDDVFVFSY